MRRIVLFLVLSATLGAIGAAQAGTDPVHPVIIGHLAKRAIVVPPEWDGIWTTVDTSYTCAGAFESTSAGSDTICGGKDYGDDGGGGITLNCTGTATATTIDQTCTGSSQVAPDCNADFTIVTHGTISGGVYFLVSTISVTYSGTGLGCDLIPPSCTQMNSHGTRTGPAPTEYCLTPTRSSTWGQIKTYYR